MKKRLGEENRHGYLCKLAKMVLYDITSRAARFDSIFKDQRSSTFLVQISSFLLYISLFNAPIIACSRLHQTGELDSVIIQDPSLAIYLFIYYILVVYMPKKLIYWYLFNRSSFRW